jgi:hypothetical protein
VVSTGVGLVVNPLEYVSCPLTLKSSDVESSYGQEYYLSTMSIIPGSLCGRPKGLEVRAHVVMVLQKAFVGMGHILTRRVGGLAREVVALCLDVPCD